MHKIPVVLPNASAVSVRVVPNLEPLAETGLERGVANETSVEMTG